MDNENTAEDAMKPTDPTMTHLEFNSSEDKGTYEAVDHDESMGSGDDSNTIDMKEASEEPAPIEGDIEEQESFVDDDNAWLDDVFADEERALAEAAREEAAREAESTDEAEDGEADHDAEHQADTTEEKLESSKETELLDGTNDDEELARDAAMRSLLMNIPSPENEAAPVTTPMTPVKIAETQGYGQQPMPFDTLDASSDAGASFQDDLPKMSSHMPMGGADAPKKRRWPLVLLAIVVALLLAYVVGGVYFTSHFLPNTTVNGEDVSNMSVGELSNYVTNLGATYKTTVKGQGLDFVIEGKDIDFTYDGATYGSEAGAQIAAWSWPMELSRPHAYTVERGISFSVEKLDELVTEAVGKFNDSAKEPTNASAKYDDDEKKFVIEPEVIGTQLNNRSVQTKVEQGVSGMSTVIDLDASDLRQPKVSRDDEQLVSVVKRANKLLKKKIPIRIAGQDAKEIDSSLLKSWLSINDNQELDVDRDAIIEWAQGPLSDEFDTVGNKRTYTRPDGKEFEIEGGTYGWMLNGEELANTIADNLLDNNTDAIDAPMKQTADSWNPNGQEWPNRYIDADLSEQHVRMYDEDGNVIWESDCVSGNTTENHGTVLGAFFIQEKVSPMKLIGLDENNDGLPDYESDVTYWMPFDGGYGLHDATWRGVFGGNIYTYNGSHGCINLPYTDAQQLYNMVNVSDAVIVHY